MRFPSLPTIIRTVYTFTGNATFSRNPISQQTLSPYFAKVALLRSMPTFPLLGSLFSSSSTDKMSYPVQKSDDEWRAVLSKGNQLYPSNLISPLWPIFQSNSASFAKKAPSNPTQASLTNICPPPGSIHAQHATRPSTKQRTNSNPAAAGRRILTRSRALWRDIRTALSGWRARRLCAVTAGDIWDMCSRGKDTRRRQMSGIALTVSVWSFRIRRGGARRKRRYRSPSWEGSKFCAALGEGGAGRTWETYGERGVFMDDESCKTIRERAISLELGDMLLQRGLQICM